MILGIDAGGSTTKIVALGRGEALLGSLQVAAGDQTTALYGAIGHLLHDLGADLGQVEQMVLTGVGASFVEGDLYGIPTAKVDEIQSIGRGGLMLGQVPEALVVSIGTGTAFVRAGAQGARHVGGSGVGGGTLLGLASRLLGERDIAAVLALADRGRLDDVDLFMGDISKTKLSTLPDHATASNFGKTRSTASDADLALGLLNMIFQTAGILAAFACQGAGLAQAVAVGTLATIPQAREMLGAVGELYHLDFIVPHRAAFATALGAAALWREGAGA